MRSKVCFPILGFLAFGTAVMLLCGVVFGAEKQDPQMAEYEGLARQYDSLRGDAGKQMSPQELAAACDDLIDDFNELIQSASSNPSVKSKSQMLLSYVYGFRGMEPESRQAYSDYLDTLESWQGTDYAVMVVRRAGERILERRKDPSKALMYCDMLVRKYPGHPSKQGALYHSGLACLEMECPTEAIERFEAAVATDPEGYYAPWALRKKAYALFTQRPAEGVIEESMEVLDELARAYPTPHWKAYVYYRKGYTLACEKKYMEALAEYAQGIEEYPASPYSWMGKRHVKWIQERLETEMLDQVARGGEEKKDGETAEAPPAGAGHVSMVFPADEDGIAEGTNR